MRARHRITLLAMPLLSMLTSAAHGAISISTAPTNNVSCSGEVCTPTAKNATLDVSDLEAMLASSSVTVTTGGATATDLIVSASFSWAGASGLTLDAYGSIEIEQPVADSGPGSLTLLTNDGGTFGALRFLKFACSRVLKAV